MKRIASQKSKAADSEDGFTLTELLAALVVASMLLAGLTELTRRYAMTSGRVKDAASEVRVSNLMQNALLELERADPASVEVQALELNARIGAQELRARIAAGVGGRSLLTWTSPRGERQISLPPAAHFEEEPGGLIVLRANSADPPIASVLPKRTVAYDCKFDVVARSCR